MLLIFKEKNRTTHLIVQRSGKRRRSLRVELVGVRNGDSINGPWISKAATLGRFVSKVNAAYVTIDSYRQQIDQPFLSPLQS